MIIKDIFALRKIGQLYHDFQYYSTYMYKEKLEIFIFKNVLILNLNNFII